MTRLFVLTTIIAASLFTSSAYSQVYVNAHVGIRLPRIHGLPIPVPVPVIYHDAYQPAPAPVYQSAPEYQEGYAPAPQCAPAPAPVVYEQEFPGAAYYTYPAWNGHYRDHSYYEHYRPYYERSHRVVYDHRGYDHRGYDHRHW